MFELSLLCLRVYLLLRGKVRGGGGQGGEGSDLAEVGAFSRIS